MFAVPLICRIHEGVKFTNRDQRSLVDKMVAMLLALSLESQYYFVADAYYAARQTILGTLDSGNHFVSRVRTNAVAYTGLVIQEAWAGSAEEIRNKSPSAHIV